MEQASDVGIYTKPGGPAPAPAESALTSILGNSDADRSVFLSCDDLLSKQEVREFLSVDAEVRSFGRVAHDSEAPRLHLEEGLPVSYSRATIFQNYG